MDWVENKYINLLSNRLRNFKRKSNQLYNFSCPICGDSEKNSTRARGYIYDKSGKGVYHCHNCGATHSIPVFIKLVDSGLYQEFLVEKLGNNKKSKEEEEYEAFVEKLKKPAFVTSGPLKGLKKVSQLSPNHPVKKFVVERRIPNPYHAKLFACPNFYHYVNNLVSDKFSADSLANDQTRLLIPFLDANKTVHAFQGRSITPNKVKYITIILNPDVPKIYGLDTVDRNRIIPVVEGPLDSMFIGNSIATAGGDLVSAVKGFDRSNLVIVYDNEPRSKETVKKLDKAILNGYSVCIWPENMEHKDINDMVLAGLSSEFIEHIIKHNTYRDLSAKLALQKWSKV